MSNPQFPFATPTQYNEHRFDTALWLGVSFGSVAIHLLAFWLLRQLGGSPTSSSPAPLAIELISVRRTGTTSQRYQLPVTSPQISVSRSPSRSISRQSPVAPHPQLQTPPKAIAPRPQPIPSNPTPVRPIPTRPQLPSTPQRPIQTIPTPVTPQKPVQTIPTPITPQKPVQTIPTPVTQRPRPVQPSRPTPLPAVTPPRDDSTEEPRKTPISQNPSPSKSPSPEAVEPPISRGIIASVSGVSPVGGDIPEQLPKLRQNQQPFPAIAFPGVGGDRLVLRVLLVIDDGGKVNQVTSAEVVQGRYSGDASALVRPIISRWRFEPATQGGSPVFSSIEVQIAIAPGS